MAALAQQHTFADNDTLTAAQLNTEYGNIYTGVNALMQTGTAAGRPAGTAGQLYFATDTKVPTQYDGAAWQTLPYIGAAQTWTAAQTFPASGVKITGTSANTVLASVATTADKTITFPNVTGTAVTTGDTGTVTNAMLAGSIDLTTKVTGALSVANGGTGLTTFTAKGAIPVATAATTLAAQAVGTDGQVLTADSTQATGMKWATASSAPVSSVFGRTGAVAAGNADYLAVASGGLTGATAAARIAGGTASGAPVSGTFAVGDCIIDQTGKLYICTVAGTPGTWTQAGMTNPMTTTGDMIYSSSGSTAARLPVGASGQPVVGGTTPSYGTVGASYGGGLVKIGETVLGASATSITFSSIPGTYRHLIIEFQGRGDGAFTNEAVGMRFNGDAASNYGAQSVFGSGGAASGGSSTGTAAQVCIQSAASAPANLPGSAIISIPNYAATTFIKTVNSTSGHVESTATPTHSSNIYFGWWNSTVAISSTTLIPLSSTNFVAGTTATLYGVAV